MTKKMSPEDCIAKLKRELYPVAIKENISWKMRYGKEVMGNRMILEEISVRVLIAEKSTRIFIESGSCDGKLRLIDFRDFKYRKDENGESLVPLCNLVKKATYDTNEKDDITTIYLSPEDSLVAPFRCGINELEEEIKREATHAGLWTKQ